MLEKKVTIIGGGVAGLSAALELARLNIEVELVEKKNFLGGYAAELKCKTNRRCVKCNACMVESKLRGVLKSPGIDIHRSAHVQKIEYADRFTVSVEKSPDYIDPDLCSKCGICLEACPVEGGILKGLSSNDIFYYAINEEKCLYVKNRSCVVCRDSCKEKAIKLDGTGSCLACRTDAILLTSGCYPICPSSKQYGYPAFDNVITSLDLERFLKQKSVVKRPSDAQAPDKIAFIQCVKGEADQMDSPVCFGACCSWAFNMVKYIKMKQPEIEITVFYPDKQGHGKKFFSLYETAPKDFRLIKAGRQELLKDNNDRLQMVYREAHTKKEIKEVFDLVVLSVGMAPGKDTRKLGLLLNLDVSSSGFIANGNPCGQTSQKGVFAAGTVKKPMTIAETVSDACGTARRVADFISLGK